MKLHRTSRMALGIVVLLIVSLGAILMGNKSASTEKSLRLRPLFDEVTTSQAQTANRLQIFGVDPLATSMELAIDVKLARNAAKRDQNSTVSGHGHLVVDSRHLPLDFDGELEAHQSEDGHDFFLGPASGILNVNGEKLYVDLVFTGIPDKGNYVVSMTIHTPDEKIALLAFGEEYPEFTKAKTARMNGNGGK